MRPALLIGIASFAVAFGVAAWVLVSIPAPSFAVEVAPESARAPEGSTQWRATVTPKSDRDRLLARLDREVDLTLRPEGWASLVADVEGLSPGYHFVEGVVYRRGGRSDSIVDVIVAGPFQEGRDRGCDAALALSPDIVRALLLPALQRKVVEGAAAQDDVFGSTTYVAQSRLDVVDGGLAFAMDLDTTAEDRGDLSIEGMVAVASSGTDGISPSLRRLDRATPGPKLQRIAESEGGKRGTTAGIGGGATVGGVVGGPVGALIGGAVGGLAGNLIGQRLGKREAKRRTREEVERAIIDGLAQATEELRLPGDFELLPTSPPLRADAQWCGALTLGAEQGIRASLRVQLQADERTDEAAATAVFCGDAIEPIGELDEASVAVAVSQDLVNRLLAEWTVRGGLTDALADAGLRAALQAELSERTRWEVQSIEATAAPALRFDDDAIAVSFGDIGLRMFDPGRDETRDVTVGGVGAIDLRVLDDHRVRFTGNLDQAYFGCRNPNADARVLPACFVGAVDPTLLRRRINLAIALHAATLPSFDLAALLDLQPPDGEPIPLTLTTAALHINPGRLDFTATLAPR